MLVLACLIYRQRVSVGWRGSRRFLGEVVLVAVAEASAARGECIFDLVKLIATR